MTDNPLFVLGISGSPSPASKTAMVVEQLLARLGSRGIEVEHIVLSTLSPTALLRGDIDDPGLAGMANALTRASGVIVGTPIFKAAYSGLLKSALDILPQFGLAGKSVLPLGTGGSPAHVLALDYGLRPVLQSMGARHIVQAHFLWEGDMHVDRDELRIADTASGPLSTAFHHFIETLMPTQKAGLLGHPRPEGVASQS